MIISCVVSEIPIGINPKMWNMTSNKRYTAKMTVVLVTF